jgi:hypothetical protein
MGATDETPGHVNFNEAAQKRLPYPAQLSFPELLRINSAADQALDS